MSKNFRLTTLALACLLGLGANAQGIQKGYYRVKNGYTRPDGKQYVQVRGKYEAQPDQTASEVKTEAGSIILLEVKDTVINGKSIYNVKTLRSQGVDVINGYLNPAIKAAKKQVDDLLKAKLGTGGTYSAAKLAIEAEIKKWDLNMHLEKTSLTTGEEAYYAYATVPSLQGAVDYYKLLKTVGPFLGINVNTILTPEQIAAFEGGADALWLYAEKLVYEKLKATYGETNYFVQLVKSYIDAKRINQGQQYSLIEGDIKQVIGNGKQYDPADPASAHNEYSADKAKFDFVNNGDPANHYYGPERPVAGDAAKWVLEPVGDQPDNYFGVKPLASIQGRTGKYYTTLYTDFPMKVMDGMTAYKISGISENANYPGVGVAKVEVVAKDGEIIPIATPVVLECNGTDPASNRLLPVLQEGVAAPTDNLLSGIFFGDDVANVLVAGKELRVLNKNAADANNPIGFYKYTGTKLAMNKAFMMLDPSMAYSKGLILQLGEDPGTTGITEVDKDKNTDKAEIFDLQGRRVTNPTHGIYIINGKKVVIK